jgi:putative ABC transport system substrate-binding protein
MQRPSGTSSGAGHRRRDVLRLAAGAAIWPSVWPLAVAAAEERVRVVGMLISLPPSDVAPRLLLFFEDMKRRGWIEGRNIRYEMRSTYGGEQVRDRMVAELVALKPDVILTSSSYETEALLKATRTIPVIFATAADPVGSGFVESLARPGRNATGFTNSDQSMVGKWLQFLKEIAPGVTRVGTLFNPASAARGGDFFLDPMREMAPGFGISLTDLRVSDPAKLENVIEGFAHEPGGGFIVPPDSFTYSHRVAIVAAIGRARTPAVYSLPAFADVGGLMTYGAVIEARGSEYVDMILRGANPADVPVQSPRRYELIINRKVAAALDLKISEALMLRADRILE